MVTLMIYKYLAILFFFSIVFISGCEGVDISKLSDEDLGRIAEKAIVCNEPYIRFGSSCCLDENSNGICDKDEGKSQESIEVVENPKEDVVEEVVVKEINQPPPITGLLLCEGNEAVDLGFLPVSTIATMCKSNRLTFGTASLTLLSVYDTSIAISVGGSVYDLTEEEKQQAITSDGTIEFWYQEGKNDNVQLYVKRLTNPFNYPDVESGFASGETVE